MKRVRFKWHNLLVLINVIPIVFVIFVLLKNDSQITNIDPANLVPVAMLLICPLIHLFMKRDMGHGKLFQIDDKTTTLQELNTK